ncbi:MAG: zinc-dependent alcohol dehydrogenase [Thermodesulfobacteriota bacterium]
MKALVYSRSVARYLLAKGLNRLWPRTFFGRLAPLRLQTMEFKSPGPPWVVLRPRLCGICGSDLNLLKGAESFLLEPYASLPAVLGHEVVAEVAESPPGSKWRAGDRVVVEPVLPCEVRGISACRFCAAGEYNLCENFLEGDLAPGVILGFARGVGGGMAEMMAAHPSRLVRVPDHVPDEVAVLTDSMASALQPVLDHFPDDRHTVVVYGAGIIGQHLIRLFRALGSAARLVAVARHPFQAELAREGGADVVLSSPSRAELGEAVAARLVPTTLGGGNLEGGADMFFDCVGSQSSIQEGLLTLRCRGTYVLVGTAGAVGPVDFSSLWFRELKLTGSAMYAHSVFRGEQIRTYEKAVELLAGGSYPSRGLVSHLFRLKDYRRAFQAAFDKRHHQSLKVALDLR